MAPVSSVRLKLDEFVLARTNLAKSIVKTQKRDVVFRLSILFTLVASLLISGLALTPDAHAGDGPAMAHVGDHIAAHGMEHFDDSEGHADDGSDSDHPPAHHHNCSMVVPSCVKAGADARVFDARLFAPLEDNHLASGALKVLIEPPKT